MDSPPLEVAFDPLHLTKEASLNRTRLADLPGADARLVGQSGFQLLRLAALHRLAAEHGIYAARPTDVPRRLRHALDSADLAEAAQARRVVAEFGRRLGHLVATLRIGVEDGSPWRTAYREHWRSVDRIWLGGGISAALGRDLLDPARAEAQRLADSSTVDLAPHAAVLALIGAARLRATPALSAIVLDFGYSSVKRGIVRFSDGGALQRLDVALPGFALPRPGLDSQSSPNAILQAVVDVICATFSAAQNTQPGGVDPEVVVSIATYLQGGWPVTSPYLYDLLGDVDSASLTDEASRATGVALQVRLVHDGTAAAAALQSNGRQGVIVLGTSLGAGFSVPGQRRLPIAANLQVIHT